MAGKSPFVFCRLYFQQNIPFLQKLLITLEAQEHWLGPINNNDTMMNNLTCST